MRTSSGLFRFLWLAVALVYLTASCGVIDGISPTPTLPLPTPTAALPTPTATPTVRISGETGAALDQLITQSYPLFSGAVLVARRGEILLSRGYLYANWELESPNTPQTKFRIASLTKAFTAAAILQLQEQGKLSVRDPICKHLESCPSAGQDTGGQAGRWEKITIHNLLTHTSGIPEYTTLPGALEGANQRRSHNELIATFQNEPLLFPPGERYSYSNSNYVLLGAIVEAVSHNNLADYLSRHILIPLGMEDSGVDRQGSVLKQRAAGYNIVGRTFVNAFYIDISNTFAAGDMYSTIEDLYRWDQALYSDLVLSSQSREAMFTSYIPLDSPADSSADRGDYGYGWEIGEFAGHRMFSHEGSLPGFHTLFERFPDDYATIIILSNIQTSDVRALADDLAEILFKGQN